MKYLSKITKIIVTGLGAAISAIIAIEYAILIHEPGYIDTQIVLGDQSGWTWWAVCIAASLLTVFLLIICLRLLAPNFGKVLKRIFLRRSSILVGLSLIIVAFVAANVVPLKHHPIDYFGGYPPNYYVTRGVPFVYATQQRYEHTEPGLGGTDYNATPDEPSQYMFHNLVFNLVILAVLVLAFIMLVRIRNFADMPRYHKIILLALLIAAVATGVTGLVPRLYLKDNCANDESVIVIIPDSLQQRGWPLGYYRQTLPERCRLESSAKSVNATRSWFPSNLIVDYAAWTGSSALVLSLVCRYRRDPL